MIFKCVAGFHMAIHYVNKLLFKLPDITEALCAFGYPNLKNISEHIDAEPPTELWLLQNLCFV